MALVHYPVRNKTGRTVATSVTNLDIHDISRSCATYGVKRFYVVTPLQEQRKVVRETMDYWVRGPGVKWNRDRKTALSRVEVVQNIAEIIDDLGVVETIATSARHYPGSVSFENFSLSMEKNEVNRLLLLGTGWGLSRSLVKSCDHVLEPVTGKGRYNHLSVRSAAAIMLDRLYHGGFGKGLNYEDD